MAAVHPRGRGWRRAARRQSSPAAAAMMGSLCQMTMSKERWRGSSCEFWSGGCALLRQRTWCVAGAQACAVHPLTDVHVGLTVNNLES